MNKLFSFFAGVMCGSIVGAVAALLITPASGAELTAEAQRRWAEAQAEFQRAQEETRHQLEKEYAVLRQQGQSAEQHL
jgi:gas vesicle protein